MGKYFDELMQDHRFREGLNACMNCGACTAVCPAAEYYNYDPRQIVDDVQARDDESIEALMKSDTIWYCGECMSCRPRCPRGNTPAYVIQALRKLSQKYGFFTESEKGRQQYALGKVLGGNMMELGYCVHPTRVVPQMHPEQGPVWAWVHEHDDDVFARFTDNYKKAGPGPARAIDPESLAEFRRIFDVSGGTEFLGDIERHSLKKAEELGMTPDEYMEYVYTYNSGTHTL